MKDRLTLVAVGLGIVGSLYGGWRWGNGKVEAWAQGAEQRVQQSVEGKIDAQQATLDLIVCTVVHGRPRPVCDCEFFEAKQLVPRPDRCARAEELYAAGRVEAADAVAADTMR